MNLHSWYTFVIATFFICATPGPNMLMMMSSSVRHGLRLTLFTMAGCYLALLLILSVSAAGLGTLLKMNPMLFYILRCIGAVYLVYLGIQAWRSPVKEITEENVPDISTDVPKENFVRGFLVGISNPKAILFATAFFPQFINPDAPQLQQFVILLATFSIIELGCYASYALGGKKLSLYLQHHTIRKLFNRFTGSIFAAFGGFLLFSKLD